MHRFALVICVVGLAACSKAPESFAPMPDDAAMTVAAHILALGQVKGCGELRVTSQGPVKGEITVECSPDGKAWKAYALNNGPGALKVDGRVVGY